MPTADGPESARCPRPLPGSGAVIRPLVFPTRIGTPMEPDKVREIVGHSDIEVTMTIYAHTSLNENVRHWAS